MTTVTAIAKPTIRVLWPNPAELRATLIHVTPSGRERERHVGPRAALTLAEAAAVLDHSRDEVRRAIRTGFLRAGRRSGRLVVTLGACHRYVRELQADLALARSTEGAPTIPADVVHARLTR